MSEPLLSAALGEFHGDCHSFQLSDATNQAIRLAFGGLLQIIAQIRHPLVSRLNVEN